MAIPLGVGVININNINTNAALAVGENQLSTWKKNRKTDNGVGLQIGVFADTANFTVINDPDVNDGNMIDPDSIPTVQGQAI